MHVQERRGPSEELSGGAAATAISAVAVGDQRRELGESFKLLVHAADGITFHGGLGGGSAHTASAVPLVEVPLPVAASHLAASCLKRVHAIAGALAQSPLFSSGTKSGSGASTCPAGEQTMDPVWFYNKVPPKKYCC